MSTVYKKKKPRLPQAVVIGQLNCRGMGQTWILNALCATLLCSYVAAQRGGLSDSDSRVDRNSSKTVQTAYGEVRGMPQNARYPGVVQFLGIPFAQPPTGNLRFKETEPPSKWSGVRDAYDFGNECLQSYSSSSFKNRTQDEDCLYLNVYTPIADHPYMSMPVMVWIHGGNYYIGAGSRYDGTALASKGVVVVTINYRLDVFGFLSTETDVIPGNYGMLDQIQALKWVQENIVGFGGDPNSVTIFGESSGSGAVSLLTLSPLAKNLFHRAIMQSGASLSPWVIDHPATRMSPRMMAGLIGQLAGCTQWDQHKLLDCFRRVDAEKLHNATRSITWGADSSTVMAPRVENVFGVIPDLPIRLLAKGMFNKVDTLMGYTADESGSSVYDDANDGLRLEEFKNSMKSALRPYAITDVDQLIQSMMNTYNISSHSDPTYIRTQTIKARSDFSVIGATINEIELKINSDAQNKHYLFEFHHRPSYSTSYSWLNALHFEDVSFVFGVNLAASQVFGGNPDSADEIVSEQMLTMWTNFAKYGDPTRTLVNGSVKWESYTTKDPWYLQIDEQSSLKKYQNNGVVDLYYKIIQKFDTMVDPSNSIVG